MEAPLITIAIPSHNRPHYLKEAVWSALNQTYPHIEVIVGHNPSGDSQIDADIFDWCSAMTRERDNFRFEPHASNIGAVSNFNEIAVHAQGEYIAFIGDDDRLAPAMVETLVAHMEPDIDVCFSNHYIIDRRGVRQYRRSFRVTEQYGRSSIEPGRLSDFDKKALAWRVGIPIFASLLKTDVFLRSPFREDLLLTDTEFFVRWAHDGKAFLFVDEYLSEVRHHKRRITSSLIHFDELRSALETVEVSEDLEHFKKRALEAVTQTSVTYHLLEGNVQEATLLFEGPYYPSNSGFKARIHQWVLSASQPIGTALFRFLHFLYNPIKYFLDLDKYGRRALPNDDPFRRSNLQK
jgi:glycosyltransferase involved in cell wall biosynthesis